MNPCSPVWNFEGDLPVPNQKTHMGFGPDNELVEILWRNGQVVLNSQTHRKPSLNPNGSRQVSGSYGKSSNLIQDDETVSWIQSPVEDSFDKDFYSTFFSEMPPPRSELDDEAAQRSKSLGGPGKAVHFSPPKGEFGSCNGELGRKGFGNSMQGEISHCSSNQVAYDLDASRASSSGVRMRTATTSSSPGNLKDDIRKVVISQGEKAKTETLDPTVTSSSGGSGSSFDRTSNKRKRRDAGESECQSEGAELESAAGNKSAQRSGGSCHRSRAAEVHNLSERRRRDRINEKMKALQELIPHCNKTDKASMLDEAIEYLKSLQLQLQVMWMGSGGMAAPMMFPGVQHYMSRMGMGMGPAMPLPSITNPMHLSRLPLVDQSMSMAAQVQNQAVMSQVHYQNQMQNLNFTNPYARYMGFHHMQTPSQPVNMFRYGSPAVQSQAATPPSGCGAFTGGAAPDNAMPL